MADAKQVVRSLYEAFGRGDVESVLGAMDADVRWNEAETQPYAEGNPYQGPQGVAEGVFGRIMDDFEGFTVNPETFVVEGKDVVAMGRYRGTRASTGEALDAQFAHHWRVENGKIVSFQQYTDTAQISNLLGNR